MKPGLLEVLTLPRAAAAKQSTRTGVRRNILRANLKEEGRRNGEVAVIFSTI